MLSSLTINRPRSYHLLQDLGYSQTIKRLALPPPDGFGIKTYRASLHRFFVANSAQLKIQHLESAATLAGGSTSTPVLASGSADAPSLRLSALHLFAA